MKLNIQTVSKHASRWMNWSAILLLILVVLVSYRRPHIPWDSWAYHLPFSAQIFNIGDYSNSFSLNKVLQDRFNGFPLVAEFAQGLLWMLTKNIASTVLINSGSLVAFILVAAKLTKYNFSILTYGMFSVPLIGVHVFSTYIDLFMGVGIAMQFIAAIRLHDNFDEASLHEKKYWYALYATSAILAGNSKMWAPLISTAISALLLIDLAMLSKHRMASRKFIVNIFILIITAMLSSATLIRNTMEFGNPVYPIEITSSLLDIKLPGPEPEYKNYPGYAENYGILARPLYFIASITQYDWAIRGVEPEYKFEDGVGDNPKRYQSARTGGWWNVLMGISSGIVCGLLLMSKFVNTSSSRSFHFSFRLFVGLCVLTSLMPQSHELRYFLYLPICLIFLVAYISETTRHGLMLKPVTTIVFMMLFLYSLFILRGEDFKSLSRYTSQSELVEVNSISNEVLAAKKLGHMCLGPEYNPNQFKYSSVFQGGDYMIEQGWFSCKMFPPYAKVANPMGTAPASAEDATSN